jgi:hypothetical protein
LAALRQEVAGLTAQQEVIEAQIATRGEIANSITEIRGRLGNLLDGDLLQLKAASEGALAQAAAIQASLEALKSADQPEAAGQPGQAETTEQEEATD